MRNCLIPKQKDATSDPQDEVASQKNLREAWRRLDYEEGTAVTRPGEQLMMATIRQDHPRTFPKVARTRLSLQVQRWITNQYAHEESSAGRLGEAGHNRVESKTPGTAAVQKKNGAVQCRERGKGSIPTWLGWLRRARKVRKACKFCKMLQNENSMKFNEIILQNENLIVKWTFCLQSA